MPTPYALSSDLVSAWPAKSLAIATYLDDSLAAKRDNAPAINAQVGTTYTFVLADATAGKTITASNASASTYTVPPQSSVAFSAGALLNVTNLGAGVVTFAGGVGVTVTNTAGTLAQYQSATLVRTASDAWTVIPSGAASGLSLVNSTATTFSAVSAVNLNNVFTSANAVFYIVGTATMSGTDRPKIRLRVGGVDATGATDYTFAWSDISGGTASGATGSTSSWNPFSGLLSGGVMSFAFTLVNPATAVFTQLVNASGFDGTPRNRSGGGRHQQSVAYDGFSITPETGGTMTGAVYVYKLQTA